MNNEEIIPEIIEDELIADSKHIEGVIGNIREAKNPVGRPIGIPASALQKTSVSKAATEYQRKLREGLIEQPEWETHGAYSYMAGGKVPKKKRYLLEFVYKERKKWLSDLGGEENLSSIEISMLDEASRLLLFSTMINDYLLSDKDSDIVFKSEEGDIHMHTALSKHYLSFTRTYMQILRELQKITVKKPSGKKGGGNKKDSASLLQHLYKNEG